MRTSHILLAVLVVTTAMVLVPWRRVDDPRDELLMTVWGMPFEDRLFRDEYARGFEALHPGITVRYQRYVDVMPKYEVWHAVGRGADVMRTPVNYYHAMVDKGMLAPLDRFIDDPELGLSSAEQADFFPWVWDALEVDGRRYALPSDNAQYGVYYNRALFDRHNARHPDQPLAYPSADWTWDDLRRAKRLLTVMDERGNVVQYGVSFELWAWPFLAFFRQAGGRLWDETQTTTLIDSSAGVAALELIAELIPKDAPIRSIEMPDTASGPDDLFKVGKLAILLDGSWRAPNVELDNPELPYAIAPLPHERERAVVTGSVVWAVSAHSRNKEMAWRMIRWLTRPQQGLKYWNMLRVAPPAQRSIVQSEAFHETDGLVVVENGQTRVLVPPMPRTAYADRAAWLEYALTPDPATGARPGFLAVAPYQADLERKIERAMVEVVRGDKTPRQALRDATREVHALIDRDRAAKGRPPVPRDGD